MKTSLAILPIFVLSLFGCSQTDEGKGGARYLCTHYKVTHRDSVGPENWIELKDLTFFEIDRKGKSIRYGDGKTYEITETDSTEFYFMFDAEGEGEDYLFILSKLKDNEYVLCRMAGPDNSEKDPYMVYYRGFR